jgi:hypothetical protein
MTQSTINGFDLLTIFQDAINEFDRTNLSSNPALAGVQVETPLLSLLETNQNQHSDTVRKLPCIFLRSLGKKYDIMNVFSRHRILFVRGSSVSGLKVSFTRGNVSIINEFELYGG